MRYPMAALLFIALMLALPGAALQSGPVAFTCPDTLRTGKPVALSVTLAEASALTLSLLPSGADDTITLVSSRPFPAGQSTLTWSGQLPFGGALAEGAYTLRLEAATGAIAEQPVTVGPPFPVLSGLTQSVDTLGAGGTAHFSITLSQAGTLHVSVLSASDGLTLYTFSGAASQGDAVITWDGTLGEESPVPAGNYALALVLENTAGDLSAEVRAPIAVSAKDHALIGFESMTGAVHATYSTGVSPVYGTQADDSFWSLPPGDTDDARIWSVLTQPIVVYDDGSTTAMGHVYLMENPDGSGRRMAQVHGLSQGLHVIGEENAYGNVLVETFSNYDPDFTPLSPQERFNAFDVFQGYVPARHLKTVPVNQQYALLIDKKTQRMYLFENGTRVTEFTISTGLIYDERYHYETIPGEFITIGHGSGYQSWDTYSDYPIRFNGGTMLHEVPHTLRDDGSKYYGLYEARLGQKHSSGCVRVPYKENAEGYNMARLWHILQGGTPYKIIIWDDRGRVDAPIPWR